MILTLFARALAACRTAAMGRTVAAAAAAGLLVAAGACARPGSQPEYESSDAIRVQERLIGLYEQVNGTTEQRAAAEKLTYIAYQGAIQRCMETASLSYQPPPFHNPYDGMVRLRLPTDLPAFVTPGAKDRLLVDVELTRSARAAAQDATHRNPGYEKLPSEQRRQYADQVSACEPAPVTYVDAFVPAASMRLDPKLLDMLRQTQGRSAVASALDGYAKCMNGKGVQANSLSDLETKVKAKFHDSAGRPLEPGASVWAKATAYQSRAVEADAACRHNIWITAMGEVEPRLDGFSTEHSAALDDLVAAWDAVQAKAERSRPTLLKLSPTS